MLEWRGRPIVIDHSRNVDREMLECGLTTTDIIDVLENGVHPVKRKEGVLERWMRVGWRVIIVVVEDGGDYWLVRHVSQVRLTRRLGALLRGDGR